MTIETETRIRKMQDELSKLDDKINFMKITLILAQVKQRALLRDIDAELDKLREVKE